MFWLGLARRWRRPIRHRRRRRRRSSSLANETRAGPGRQLPGAFFLGHKLSGAIALGQGGPMGRATAETRVLEFAEALAVVLRHAAKVHRSEEGRGGPKSRSR